MLKPLQGVDIKLSYAFSGELRITTPAMFGGYYNDAEATEAAFDEQGFFKTGDMAFLKENRYVLEKEPPTASKFNIHEDTNTCLQGDYFDTNNLPSSRHSRGYEVSIPKIELAISELPYVAESHVLLLPPNDKPQGKIRCIIAVLLRTRPSCASNNFLTWDVSLSKLWKDLAKRHVHLFSTRCLLCCEFLGDMNMSLGRRWEKWLSSVWWGCIFQRLEIRVSMRGLRLVCRCGMIEWRQSSKSIYDLCV